MWLECSCEDIDKKTWDELMKHRRHCSYEKLIKLIKKDEPRVYKNLMLDLYNPYKDYCWSTPTHYVLTHSSIEYFFNKDDSQNPNYEEDNIYENKQNMKKVIRLTESDLHRIVENSVKKMLKEFDLNNDYQQRQLGHAAGWAQKKCNAATNDADWNKYHNMMRTAEKHANLNVKADGGVLPSYGVGRSDAMQK